MEQEQQNGAQSAGLIYGLNDRPPLKDAIFAALQHLLAIFVAIITPPLIIAGALKLDLETTGFWFPWHFCVWNIYFYSMSASWSNWLWIAVYTRNQFLFHRSDYFCWADRRAQCHIRSLYRRFIGRDAD